MFKYVKPGDTVTRMLSSARIPMTLIVEKVENGVITCKGGWTFDVKTGAEIDDDLQWGPKWGATGSQLVVSH